jgi:predicted aminopeptidase
MAHATVYIKSDADFNENLATFVGNQGSIEYFKARGGPRDPRVQEAQEDEADDRAFQQELTQLRADLDAVYKSGATRAEKLARKASTFEAFKERYRKAVRPTLHSDDHDWVLRRELNNALILAEDRYHADLDVFVKLHEKLGSNMRTTVAKLRELSDKDDPRAEVMAASR